MNMNVSSEKRGALKDYMEGYKDAISKKTEYQPPMMPPMGQTPNSQPPMMGGQPPMMPQGQGMGMPPMPPQGGAMPMMPPQPPMMMNMGGMVDVFDPVYMQQGGTIIQTGPGGKIATRPVFDEDRGRMVSQILSRDDVNAMKQSALGGGLANIIQQGLDQEKQKEIIAEQIAEETMKPDESERNIPFTQTVVEQETSDIGLPTPKPTAEDFLYDVTNTDEMSRFADIPLPISKPDRAEPVDTFDEARELMQRVQRLEAPDELRIEEDEISNLFPNTPPPGLLDQKLYYEAPPEVSPSPSNKQLISDMVSSISPPPFENKFPFSSEVNVDEKLDNFVDNSLSAIKKRREEEEGIGLLAKILQSLRLPRFGDFTASSGQGVDSFYNGGIVQGFRNGGDVYAEKDKFTTNLQGNVSGRARDVKDERDRLMELDYGSPVSAFDRVLQGNVGYDKGAIDEKTKLALQNVMTTNYPMDHSSVVTPPYEFTGDQFDDSNIDEMAALPVTPFKPITQPELTADQGAPDNTFGFNQFTRPIIDLMGYDTSTPAGAGQYYADTARADDAYFRGQEERKRDEDRAQRKLAEEQSLRDMIAGMLPPTVATTPTPADPIVTPPVETTPPDYSDVVVPSDRIPGFDINKISPYPTFNVPGTPTAPAIIPSGITPELLRELFKMQGVPAASMNQGGSVNTLDNAVDNFLGSLRSAA